MKYNHSVFVLVSIPIAYVLSPQTPHFTIAAYQQRRPCGPVGCSDSPRSPSSPGEGAPASVAESRRDATTVPENSTATVYCSRALIEWYAVERSRMVCHNVV